MIWEKRGGVTGLRPGGLVFPFSPPLPSPPLPSPPLPSGRGGEAEGRGAPGRR